MKVNSVLKRRVCKSYREFCKIERKYGKYFDYWKCKHWKQFRWRLNNLYFIWISYRINTLDELKRIQKSLNNQFKKTRDNNTFKRLLNIVIENYGNIYKKGTLIGLEITNEDFYWIYKDQNGKCIYSTCVARLGE